MPLLFPNVQGRPLTEVLGKEPGSPTVLRQLLDLAGALATLHGQGVYLGFIEPSAVVIQANGRVGFARWPTLSGQINLLARQYQAPEILQRGPETPRADVYSLGVLLREALTGSTSPAKYAHHEALQAVVDRATARAASERFADARSFQDAMRDALSDDRDAGSSLGAAHDLANRMRRLHSELRRKAKQAREHGDDSRAALLEDQADRVRLELSGAAQTMLALVPGDVMGRTTVIELARIRAKEAETRRDGPALEAALDELREHGTPEDQALLAGHGRVWLRVEPDHAKISLFQLREDRRGESREPWGEQRFGALEGESLPAGAWQARVQCTGYTDATVSFEVPRAKSFPPKGGNATPTVQLLRDKELKVGERFIPAGHAWLGGDPKAPHALRRRLAFVPSFVIQERPVTHGEYCAFLDALNAQRRESEVRQWMPRAPDDAGALVDLYTRGFAGKVELPPQREAPHLAPSVPVVGIPRAAAEAYALWFSVQSGKRWRLPSDVQWEKAARGGDGRWYPWGDLLPFRGILTAETAADRFPDVRQPESDVSPYGVAWMGGGVREWTASEWDAPSGVKTVFDRIRSRVPRAVVKGASYLESGDYARCAARGRAIATRGHLDVGFRLVRELG